MIGILTKIKKARRVGTSRHMSWYLKKEKYYVFTITVFQLLIKIINFRARILYT